MYWVPRGSPSDPTRTSRSEYLEVMIPDLRPEERVIISQVKDSLNGIPNRKLKKNYNEHRHGGIICTGTIGN